jgi:hypothetical protein
MSTVPKKRVPNKKVALACAATILAAGIATGCGGTQSSPAVQLALAAPTEGAFVTARNIKVFGTVTPASAVVVVGGKRTRVEHGAFARWMTLHKGLSHIKIVASASGYTPADLSIAVTSSPSTRRPPAASAGVAPSAGGGVSSAATSVTTAGAPAGSRYAPRVQATFLHSCEIAAGEAAAAVAVCKCALSHVEATVSESALRATELAIVKGEVTVPQWMRDAGLACRKP